MNNKNSNVCRTIFCAAGLLSLACGLLCEETSRMFRIGSVSAAPGSTAAGYLDVARGSDPETKIPITIIHGRHQGPVLALVAGVHGYEYPPILALYCLTAIIDPEALNGTLLLVHIANLPGFQKRIIYYNPYDWKNLNRVFPGDSSGTQVQRIAAVITDNVIRNCDYLIDLHCGDGNEALIPYCYWMISGNHELDEKTKRMTQAFGLKYIIIDESRTRDLSASKYLGNTAILMSKPAITTESGYLGRTDELAVKRNIDGIASVMRLLKMIPGKPDFIREPVWISRYQVVYSESDGLFYPETEMGYYVSKGERVGHIRDYLGKFVRDIRSPFTGIVMYIIGTPPIGKDEPIFEVGMVREGR